MNARGKKDKYTAADSFHDQKTTQSRVHISWVPLHETLLLTWINFNFNMDK